MNNKRLRIEPLTQTNFSPFGEVIESADRDSFLINNGMAERFHALARVDIKGDDAHPVISLVKSQQYHLPRKVDHIECHPLGSQAFVPLDQTRFVIVVAKAGNPPQAHDLTAFITNGHQGINYHTGTWHHVLLTPYAAMNFICIDRTGSGNNCIDHYFEENQQYELQILD